jgi:hypothetical protein
MASKTTKATRRTDTSRAASRFLADAGIVLRYKRSASVPLASLFDIAADDRTALVLVNTLIAKGEAIEVTCVGDRVCLAHETLVPALYALARRDVMVSETGKRVFEFLKLTPRPTAGMVRAELGVPPKTFPNAADDALAELQRFMLIDRGAADVPDTGIMYLPKDGIPYRIFDDVHRVKKLAPAKAIAALLAYFDLPVAKKLFKRIVRKDEWPKIK